MGFCIDIVHVVGYISIPVQVQFASTASGGVSVLTSQPKNLTIVSVQIQTLRLLVGDPAQQSLSICDSYDYWISFLHFLDSHQETSPDMSPLLLSTRHMLGTVVGAIAEKH